MSKLSSIAIVVVAACGSPPPPSLPWVHGLTPTATSDVEAPGVAEHLAALVGDEGDQGYGGLEVSANGMTVLASYQQGVAVVDASGRLIARARGFDVEGSADDLVALAIGDAQVDTPVIALAVTRGGHRESTTSLVLYRVGERGQLDRLFEGPIEEHDGDQTFAGAVTLIPHGLIYQPPHGDVQRWQFDPARGRYVVTQVERDRRALER